MKAWYRRGIIRSEQAKFMEAKADMREALVYESSAGGRKHIEKQLELVRADFATTAADKIPSVEPNVLTDGGCRCCPGVARKMHAVFCCVLQTLWHCEQVS